MDDKEMRLIALLVIEQAMRDAVSTSKRVYEVQARESAINFINASTPHQERSLTFWCTVAEIAPDKLQARLREVQEDITLLPKFHPRGRKTWSRGKES